MKKILAFAFFAVALMAVDCNPDGTEAQTVGDATPATTSSIVGKWYYPNELLNLDVQPEFNFNANGTVTGNYEGTWEIGANGVLTITTAYNPVYARPYTMYNNTVLILRFDIPELDKDGNPVINMGEGYVEFFYKDGKAAANNKADIMGKWACIEGWDENGDGEIGEDEQMTSVSVSFEGDKFELIIHVWNGELYSGTYTYKDGFVYFHPTKWVTSEGEMDPKKNSLGYDNNGDFAFPFIGNGNEAYAYIMEGRGNWKRK